MALFAWVAAHWIWVVMEPAAPVRAIPIPSEADLSARITSGGAFGFSRAEETPASSGAAQLAQLDARIRLLGLALEPGARGRRESQALFKIDKRILWLRAGDELDPGVKLAAIEADGVRLSANGRDVRMALRVDKPAVRSGTVAGAPVVAASGVAVARPGDPCKLAPEQRSRAYVLRPEIVDSVMRERSSWADLFKASATGLVVHNSGGTGAMLGLYSNDVLSKADGAQLSSTDDMLRLVLQPLARSDSVVVTGSRAGQPREWIYAGMSCINR